MSSTAPNIDIFSTYWNFSTLKLVAVVNKQTLKLRSRASLQWRKNAQTFAASKMTSTAPNNDIFSTYWNFSTLRLVAVVNKQTLKLRSRASLQWRKNARTWHCCVGCQKAKNSAKNFGGFHLYLFPFKFPFIYIPI
jgi:hypothetical protein